jgi:hypothetical protein
LKEPPFDALRDRVRLIHLFLENDSASYADIDQQAFWPDGAGVDGFGFDFNEGSLFSKIAYVKSLGLSVVVFGNSKYCQGEIFVASMREEVDSLSVDYPVGLARQVVEENNNLLYLNVWDQFEPWRSLPDPNSVLEPGVMDVTYWDWDPTAPKTLPVNSGDAPTLRYWSRDLGDDMFGGVLDFDRSLGQRLAFPDTVGPNGRLDNWSCGGYLLAAVANFDLNDSIGYDVVSKAESSGFFLDRNRGTRFGVHINNTYKIAEGARLPTNGSYLLIGSYDGHGPVRFWARGGLDFTEDSGGPVHGGATQNDYEMMIGADPGVSGPGSFFDGKLQRVSLLAWGHHPVPPDLVKRYAGQSAKACSQSPHIDVELAVNANDPTSPTKQEDTDSPPGTSVPLNEPVKLTYMVSNPGDTPIDMSVVTLGTQVHQTPGDPTNPPQPSSVDVDGYNTGDTNRDLLLDPGEIWQYELFYENAPPDLPAGARTVEAIVNHSTEAELSDCDMSHYHVP